MAIRKVIRTAVFCTALAALASMAGATGWTSFLEGNFTGISVIRDNNEYTLSLGTNATVNGMHVYEIQGFYLVSTDGAASFYASGSDFRGKPTDKKDWKWDDSGKPAGWKQDQAYPVSFAGWSHNANGQGNDDQDSPRIEPGESLKFTFNAANFNPAGTTFGLHVGYDSPSGRTTEFYKGNLSTVPEPGSILAACSILGPVGFVFRRRRK